MKTVSNTTMILAADTQ